MELPGYVVLHMKDIEGKCGKHHIVGLLRHLACWIPVNLGNRCKVKKSKIETATILDDAEITKTESISTHLLGETS
jgi:hypothetical protein